MAEKKKKTITGQVLNSIKINKLKCINGLNEIIFKPHALTAILGPNGSGKSTILHAIASIYMPEKGFPGEDHRLMHFFPRSPHAEWNGSDFIVNLTYRKDVVMIENVGFGVAMKNALDEVKNKANDITLDDNNNDGVVNYLKSILK